MKSQNGALGPWLGGAGAAHIKGNGQRFKAPPTVTQPKQGQTIHNLTQGRIVHSHHTGKQATGP